jgi:hypothetical protein
MKRLIFGTLHLDTNLDFPALIRDRDSVPFVALAGTVCQRVQMKADGGWDAA